MFHDSNKLTEREQVILEFLEKFVDLASVSQKTQYFDPILEVLI